MKYSLFIVILFGLFSCDKVKDHYRISSVTVKVGKVSRGLNNQCILIGTKSDVLYDELIALQMELIRDYYSTDSSISKGLMAHPMGWKGCKEKIANLVLTSESYILNDFLFSDSTITGVGRDKINWGHCQEKFGCDCRNSLSIASIDSLVTLFNNQHLTKTRIFIGEQYDKTPFVFFMRKKYVESLNGKRIKIRLELSNGEIIEAESNKIRL
jgi:hypothetical protein